MKSFVNVTEQIDDLHAAATQLLAGTSPEKLQKNTAVLHFINIQSAVIFI